MSTEGNENQESQEQNNQEQQVVQEVVANEVTTETAEQSAVEDVVVENEYDEDFQSKVVNYFKGKGKNVESVDDLFKEPETVERIVEKEVNPYADINFDEDDLQYLQFKKETKRSRKEFDLLNQDLDSISPIELARQRIEKETGEKFTSQDAIDYLEDKFGMDLSDMEGLSAREKIDLKTFIKPIKDELVSQKEKYKQPIEVSKNQNIADDNLVTLENGQVMTKDSYEKQLNIRNSYLEQVKDLPNNVDKLSFKFNVDDGGVKKEIDFNYDVSKQDTQDMVSKLSDIDGTIKKHFSNKDGSVNTKALGIALQFGTEEKLGKLANDAYQRGRAEFAEETARTDNNVNYKSNELPKKNNSNYETKIVPVDQIFNR